MKNTNFFSKKKRSLLLVLIFCAFNVLSAQNNYWTLFSQSIEMSSDVKLKFKLTASIKTVTDEPQAWAGIWARVDNKNEETGFFDNMRNRPVVSSEWDTYEINGYIDENTESLNFGGLCLYNGEFYFDNLRLYVENPKTGKLEPFELDNQDLEVEILNNKVPFWDRIDPALPNPESKNHTFELVENGSSKNLALRITATGITPDNTYMIGKREGYTKQIGTLISMLNNLSSRVENQVKYLDQRELDHLHDEKANSIGALIMHLAAAEKIYQFYTFENRGFNEEEEKFWGPALNLDDAGRETYKGHDVEYYLKIYRDVRAKTLEEFKKLDDSWLEKVRPGASKNNFYYWFHVMEHQSSHLGQILFLKKRIPPPPTITVKEKKKID